VKSKVFKIIHFISVMLVVAIFIYIQFKRPQTSHYETESLYSSSVFEHQESYVNQANQLEETEQIDNLSILSIYISDHYITNIGNPDNLYFIDDNLILWGTGRNDYGQLGLGKQDQLFHNELVKIAENVIHVDYTQNGIVIYITTDGNLYGLGNASIGILELVTSFSHEHFFSYGNELNSINEPILLMDDVAYARLGRSSIAVLKNDHSVWIWGVIWYRHENNFYYQKHPLKVLDDAVLITGGQFNHAALLKNGTVWTWGYNYSGNCGIPVNEPVVSVPQMVFSDAIMVWTGRLYQNIDVFDINEFDGFFPRDLENTIIEKSDGSFWICGMGVGNEEKIIPLYFEATDFPAIFSHEFQPYVFN